ncbi:FAD-dependent monooxygenase [Brevibacterium aurantiacum]|uniref:FAD-dependent monooxygenase n=1 Tax=Brevibacterium aurantiacum TaxID=273384 RepID=UPI0013FDCB76|nr:FAD-dependent monooxygenase [Brevibacterium aurantiacum]
MEDVDVTIVGGGPVGLVLASFLAAEGVKVVVLEKEDDVISSPRAAVYLNWVLPDLERAGLLEGMMREGFLDRVGFTIHLGARNEKINIPLDTLVEDGFPYPFNINMGQHILERIGLERLAELPNARVQFATEVTGVADHGDHAEVTAVHDGQAQTIRSSFVVGADGARSFVRSAIGAKLDGFTWDDRFVAANLQFDFDRLGFNPNNLYVHPTNGCVIARLDKNGLWRYTYQEDGSLPEETVSDRILDRLAALIGPDEAKKAKVVDFNPYRMHQRVATTMRNGRILLAGDAAHITNPTGGMGLTSGLYDDILLQEILLAILRGDADLDALDYYATDRVEKFTQIASAGATALKTMVFDTRDVDEQSRGLQPQREASKSPDLQRQFIAATDQLRSEPFAARSTV